MTQLVHLVWSYCAAMSGSDFHQHKKVSGRTDPINPAAFYNDNGPKWDDGDGGSVNFPMGSLMALSPAGTERSACAAVIEGTGLETKKMTTDEQWAFISMIFSPPQCCHHCADTCTCELKVTGLQYRLSMQWQKQTHAAIKNLSIFGGWYRIICR